MRRLFVILLSAALLHGGLMFAQDGYGFTDVKVLPVTPVKDQNRSGTCWAFSGIGFLEAEMLRKGKPEVDLSEMFIVWHTYMEKAEKTVRMHGHLNFSGGGAFHDVTEMIKKYGIVPEQVYTGLNYGEEKHVHGELDELMKTNVEAIVENKNRKLSPVWKTPVQGILDAYLGEIPQSFDYQGKTYTPQQFAKDYVGLNMDDYVEISSFTHHPFYEKFILEIPDNWMWGAMYNVPIDELMAIIDNAIDKGYPVAWASDVSERGFNTSAVGIAIVPDADIAEMSDAEIAKWETLTAAQKENELYKFDKPRKEKNIDQQMRQEAFDNYQTTDDHGMIIFGTATDRDGGHYYKVKNSWGPYNARNGCFYASKAFVRYKTMDIMVHKDAIPKNIRKKLKID
ncbi:MAG: aminopeptidase [Bacteroidales bacterium]|jgi:bleomycin hydrolase|nr:aminopeptidase [Bacteroidales bacterium]